MALYKLTSHHNEKNLSIILEEHNYRTILLTHDNTHFESILSLLESEENGTKSTETVEQEIIDLVDENQSIAKLLQEIDPELTVGEYNKIFYKQLYRLTPVLQVDMYAALREVNKNPEDDHAMQHLHALINYFYRVYRNQEHITDDLIDDNGVYAWLKEHGIGLTAEGNIRALKVNIGNLENLVTHDQGIKIGDKVFNRTLKDESLGNCVVMPDNMFTPVYTEIQTEQVDGIAEYTEENKDFSNMTQSELLEYLQKSQRDAIQLLLNSN